MEKKYNIAVIGATGNVGREVIRYLEDRNFPVKDLVVAASIKSVGKVIAFKDMDLLVQKIEDIDFSKINIAFFCSGSLVSKEYAPKAANAGCVVIDKSSYFRLQTDIVLAVPEVNSMLLKDYTGIIANPNCCVIPLAVVLKIIDNFAKIKRTIISTYQSVSGAGKKGMDELYNQTKSKFALQDTPNNIFPTRIAFNLFPHIGDFREDGYTDEEYKITEELKKILGAQINPSLTCVRVPVFVSHSMSVNVEFEEEVDIKELEELLQESEDITFYDQNNNTSYATPVDATGEDSIFVSRLRKDTSSSNAVNMWIVSDNLRKGAALNAVQIAELVTGDFS